MHPVEQARLLGVQHRLEAMGQNKDIPPRPLQGAGGSVVLGGQHHPTLAADHDKQRACGFGRGGEGFARAHHQVVGGQSGTGSGPLTAQGRAQIEGHHPGRGAIQGRRTPALIRDGVCQTGTDRVRRLSIVVNERGVLEGRFSLGKVEVWVQGGRGSGHEPDPQVGIAGG